MTKRLISFFFLSVIACSFVLNNPVYSKQIKEVQRMQPYLAQPDGHTCGPTSAVMLLKYYGKRSDINTMKSKARTSYFDVKVPGTAVKVFTFKKSDWGYTNPNHLRNALNDYLMVTKKEGASVQDIASAIQKNRPVIALVRNGMTTFHYFVIVGYETNRQNQVTHWVIVDTDGRAPQRISHSNFMRSWDFEPVDYYTGAKERFECRACKGDGKAWTKCVTCSGSGKWSAFGGWTKCTACSGTGKWSSKCPVCFGKGRFHDFVLDAVNIAGVKRRTIIVPNSSPSFPGGSSGTSSGSSSGTSGSTSGGGTSSSSHHPGGNNSPPFDAIKVNGLWWSHPVTVRGNDAFAKAQDHARRLGGRLPTEAEFRSATKTLSRNSNFAVSGVIDQPVYFTNVEERQWVIHSIHPDGGLPHRNRKNYTGKDRVTVVVPVK